MNTVPEPLAIRLLRGVRQKAENAGMDGSALAVIDAEISVEIERMSRFVSSIDPTRRSGVAVVERATEQMNLATEVLRRVNEQLGHDCTKAVAK